MAERRSTGSGGRSGGRRTTKSSSASRSKSSASSRSRSSASKSRASSARSASARTAAARKGGKARGRQQRARKQASRAANTAAKGASRAGVEAKTVAELREALRKNLIRPLDVVMITRDRIEEVVNEAVKRQEIAAKDARKLATRLTDRGRKQTNDILKDLEQLLGRGRDEIDTRTKPVRKRGTDAARKARRQVERSGDRARTRAVRAADPALAQADRVRRTVGVGANFPISLYDDLTAAQITSRLGDLTAAQLRKVRDYERRNANRKSVLNAIEQKLAVKD